MPQCGKQIPKGPKSCLDGHLSHTYISRNSLGFTKLSLERITLGEGKQPLDPAEKSRRFTAKSKPNFFLIKRNFENRAMPGGDGDPQFFYFVPEQQQQQQPLTHARRRGSNVKGKGKKKTKRAQGNSNSTSTGRPTSNQRPVRKNSLNKKKSSSIRLGGATGSPSKSANRFSIWTWFLCSCTSSSNDVVDTSRPTELPPHVRILSPLSLVEATYWTLTP